MCDCVLGGVPVAYLSEDEHFLQLLLREPNVSQARRARLEKELWWLSQPYTNGMALRRWHEEIEQLYTDVLCRIGRVGRRRDQRPC